MRSLCNLLVGAVLAVGVSLYASPEALACGSCGGHSHCQPAHCHQVCVVKCYPVHCHTTWRESCTHSHTRYGWCVDPWPTGDYRRVYLDTHYYTHSWPVHGVCR